MQALARKNSEARNIQQLYAQPGFDQFSPEGIKQLAQAGGYKAGIAAATGARQNEQLLRQTAATNAGLEKTYQELGVAKYTEAQNSLAAIPPGDAKSYAEWDRVHGPAFRANGVNIPTPEQWAQDPTGKLQGHMVSTSQTVRERAAKREEAGQFTVQMTDAGPVATNKLGQFRMATELRDGAPMGGGAGAPAVGGAPMGGAGAPAMPGAGAAPAGFDMDRAKQAIAGIESGGRYGALGPVTNRGDRAFGKYQVMGANIPSWTKEALGRSMTPAEFLASPEAQERVFETQFGKSVAKYGNPADAASVWFSGRPLAKAGNASDVLGTTVPQYAQKFMAAYEGGANTPAMMRAPGFASSSGIPANVGLPVAPVLNAFAGQQPPQQGNALAMQPVPMTTAQPQIAPAPATFEEAQRAAAQRKLALDVQKASAETKAREEAKLAVAKPEAERVQEIAKEGFATTLSNMVEQIQELGKKGMLVKPGETGFANRVKAGLSDVSPRITTMLSPERGENVSTYANLRLSLLTALMAVTGKTASQINSDKELSVNLDALSSPGQSVKSIADTLNNLSEQYGTGKKYKVEDLTGGRIQNPDADSGVPLGRRGAAPTAAATAAPAGPAAANVPAAAAARLKANPSEASQFDAIFGVGSAARILGR